MVKTNNTLIRSIGQNEFVYGMHDTGGEHLMDGNGWVVITEEVGHNPNDTSGANYSAISDQGLGVISRLNNGYGATGTIPLPEFYRDFAVRCGNFVQASQGCNLWIIGNEPNLQTEWPEGTPIFPGDYATCYKICREEIHKRPGHENDLVLLAGPGPWNNSVKYSTNPTGDWVQYLQDQIWGIQDFAKVDGLALHTYTHGHYPPLIKSSETMNPPFENRYYQFWAYKDFLNALKTMGFLDKPLYFTESNGNDPNWTGGNNGWVKDAYKDINEWNMNNPRQLIRCLVLFRWQEDPLGFSIVNRPGVQQDFVEAIQYGFTWVDPEPPPTIIALAFAEETANHLAAATESNNNTIDALKSDRGDEALIAAQETATHLVAATESNDNTIDALKDGDAGTGALAYAKETAIRLEAATDSNNRTIESLQGGANSAAS